MRAALRRAARSTAVRRCAYCLGILAEPACHALGIPHPEGLATQVVNLYVTTIGED